jgi:kynureninase
VVIQLAELFNHPNALAEHYRHFSVDEQPGFGRLLLTGHSHQAWPDCAREGVLAAYDDTAKHLDEKWSLAFAKGRRVKEGFAQLLGDSSGTYALGASTHDLLLRFLSALPLAKRPRLLTTDGEFHSIRRQLDRLAEEGLEIVKLSAKNPNTLAERLAAEVDDRTAAIFVSSVLFSSGRIVPGLHQVMAAAELHGAELLVDAYHALCAVPFSLPREQIEGAFVVGGGYKYCQLGEGNCFLRVPEGCQLRPVITGWFAEFADLAQSVEPGHVAYGEGAERFAGSTYDSTSQYRASAVLNFFQEMGLTPEFLRQISQHQVGLLASEFDALDIDPQILRRDVDVPLSESGGFLVLHTPHAASLCAELRRRGVSTDFRGASLRLGPAPYLCNEQLRDGISCLGEAAKAI